LNRTGAGKQRRSLNRPASISLRGWPTHTILRGELVYQEGRFLAEPGVGKFIPRKVS